MSLCAYLKPSVIAMTLLVTASVVASQTIERSKPEVAEMVGATQPPRLLAVTGNGVATVSKDWMVLELSYSIHGDDLADVQLRVQRSLNAGLNVLNSLQSKYDVRASSNGVDLQPGKAGWYGRGVVTVEGSNFSVITQAIEAIPAFEVTQVSYTVSNRTLNQARERAEMQALTDFKDRAHRIASGFDFSEYSFGQVSVEEGAVLIDRSTQSGLVDIRYKIYGELMPKEAHK